MTASPSATIATALFLPQERIPREPLAAWAGRLRGVLRAARGQVRKVRAYASEVAEVSNNTGLIAASQGDRALARRVCHGQMRWAGRLGRRSGDVLAPFFAVQAYTNLGRLDALDGRLDLALARFSALSGFEAVPELRLDCMRVDGAGWHATADSRHEYAQMLERMHVVESLKALLMNRRHQDVLDFASRVRPGHPAEDVAREATAVSACGVGDYDTSIDAAQEGIRASRGWDRMVFRMRLAEALSCAGEGDDACRVLAPLAAAVRQLSDGARGSLNALHVSQRLAGACREAGLQADACAVAEGVYHGARAAGDEVFEIESLRVLAAVSAPDDQPRWQGALAGAEQETHYARYRRGGPGPAHPELAGLYADVQEVLAA